MPLHIIRNDITKVKADAIVNAANSRLLPGGGVCGAIFAAAGREDMQAACERIGYCREGGAVATDAFGLDARRVIHTVGPVWRGGGHGEQDVLRACYLRSLELAADEGLTSVAFPLISAGVFGYPAERAVAVAVSAIQEFLLAREMTVYLVLYDAASFALGTRLAPVAAYIDDRYVDERPDPRRHGEERQRQRMDADVLCAPQAPCEAPRRRPAPTAPWKPASARWDDILAGLEDGFSLTLFRLIDERGLSDPEVYKRANLDRKLFSKIRGNRDYRPSKNTALALCVALELNLDETRDLLRRAGLALSPSSKFDLVVEYFIRNRIYDVFAINEALYAFDQSLLGA